MSLADFRLPAAVRQTIASLAPVICTDDARGLEGPLTDEVELFLRAIPAHLRVGMVAGLVAFEASPMLRPGTLGRRFSRLAPDEARHHFARWATSSNPVKKQLAKALKMFVAFAYYELPEVKAKLAYLPDKWIGEVARKRLETWSEAIQKHEAALLAPDPLVPREVASNLKPRETARGRR